MRIQWLNDEKTEAYVTRGIWWWRRVAVVRRNSQPLKREYNADKWWVYAAINKWVEHELDAQLEERRDEDRTWARPGSLPSARVLP